MSDAAQILLLVKLLTEAIKTTTEILDLAKRVLAGDPITDDELKAAAAKMNIAVDQWDEAAGEPPVS